MRAPPNTNVAVLVFYMQGCPACEEYKPRLEKIAKRHPKIPTYIVDANENAQAADFYKVQAVPVTFVLRRPTGVIREEGAVDDSRIAQFYDVAERYA